MEPRRQRTLEKPLYIGGDSGKKTLVLDRASY